MSRPRPAASLAAAALTAGLVVASPTARAAEEPPASPATAAPSAATAAAPAPAPPRPEGRELNGHRFMPAVGVVSPFANTSFGTWLTVGQGSTTGSVELPLPDGSLQTYSGSVEYAAIGGVIAGEVKVLRGVSIRYGLTETLYSGTTGASVAAVGTNARLGGSLGLTAGLPIGQSVRVAAVIDASYVPRIGLLLGPAVKDAYESCLSGASNCEFDFSKLFDQKNVFEVQPGVAASWAPLRSLGLTANVSWSHSSIERSNGGNSTLDGLVLGAVTDFDFLAVTPVPVGLQLTLSSFVPVNGGSLERYTDLGGGILYTGRKDVSVGLQVVNRRFRVTPTVDVSWSTLVAIIGLRYYW